MNMCLDVQGDGQTDGTPVQIWECNGHDGQKWDSAGLAPRPASPFGDVWHKHDGKCFTAHNSSESIHAELVDCDLSIAEDRSQAWNIDGEEMKTMVGGNTCCVYIREGVESRPLILIDTVESKGEQCLAGSRVDADGYWQLPGGRCVRKDGFGNLYPADDQRDCSRGWERIPVPKFGHVII